MIILSNPIICIVSAIILIIVILFLIVKYLIIFSNKILCLDLKIDRNLESSLLNQFLDVLLDKKCILVH